ncbi:MAG: hypothetical protein M1549_00335 [Candidatus Dependentiae bacterium]|nr:hypothetical protein [Candidatus Dependentiae bacterium]
MKKRAITIVLAVTSFYAARDLAMENGQIVLAESEESESSEPTILNNKKNDFENSFPTNKAFSYHVFWERLEMLTKAREARLVQLEQPWLSKSTLPPLLTPQETKFLAEIFKTINPTKQDNLIKKIATSGFLFELLKESITTGHDLIAYNFAKNTALIRALTIEAHRAKQKSLKKEKIDEAMARTKSKLLTLALENHAYWLIRRLIKKCSAVTYNCALVELMLGRDEVSLRPDQVNTYFTTKKRISKKSALYKTVLLLLGQGAEANCTYMRWSPLGIALYRIRCSLEKRRPDRVRDSLKILHVLLDKNAHTEKDEDVLWNGFFTKDVPEHPEALIPLGEFITECAQHKIIPWQTITAPGDSFEMRVFLNVLALLGNLNIASIVYTKSPNVRQTAPRSLGDFYILLAKQAVALWKKFNTILKNEGKGTLHNALLIDHILPLVQQALTLNAQLSSAKEIAGSDEEFWGVRRFFDAKIKLHRYYQSKLQEIAENMPNPEGKLMCAKKNFKSENFVKIPKEHSCEHTILVNPDLRVRFTEG